MSIKYSKIIWGIFLLLAAAFLIINQSDNFMDIGFGSIIISVLSIILIVQCIANFQFAFLPIPLAALYYIYQIPLDLPAVQLKFLVIASILASVGLAIMIPGKHIKKSFKFKLGDSGKSHHQKTSTENTKEGNNQSIKVNYGSISRRICADNLETVELNCNFGAMEIFFNQAVLSPNGAVVDLSCSFGAILLVIPKNWKVVNQLNCSLGGVDMDNNFSISSENAPQLTITGNVSLGGVEISSI